MTRRLGLADLKSLAAAYRIAVRSYVEVKALSVALQRAGFTCTVDDLTAMEKSSDPFYLYEMRVRRAHWFVEVVWPRVVAHFGARIVHLRDVHYFWANVAHGTYPGVEGRGRNTAKEWPYTVTKGCGDVLSDAYTDARVLGLADHIHIIDAKNPDWSPVEMREPPTPFVERPDWWASRLPTITVPSPPYIARPDPEVGGYDYTPGDEAVALYLWSEKSGTDDLLEDRLRRQGITYIPLSGTSSTTRIIDMIDKVRDEGRPVRVGYLSDADPNGQAMPRQIARTAELFIADGRLIVPSFALTRIALTWAQVEHYDLPDIPVAPKDKASWPHDGRVELDALMGIRPGILEALVDDWAAPYRTGDLRSDLADAASSGSGTAVAAWSDHTVTLEERLDAYQRESEAMLDRHAATFAALDGYNADVKRLDRWAERLDEAIERTVDSFDPDLPDRPEPETVDDSDDLAGWLYDSRRSYLEQLVAYREHDDSDDS